MIVKATLGLVRGLLGLFPAYALPSSMDNLGSSIGNSVSGANSVFPVVTLGVCLGVVVGLRLFLALVDLAVWVYGLIPFKAT